MPDVQFILDNYPNGVGTLRKMQAAYRNNFNPRQRVGLRPSQVLATAK